MGLKTIVTIFKKIYYIKNLKKKPLSEFFKKIYYMKNLKKKTL